GDLVGEDEDQPHVEPSPVLRAFFLARFAVRIEKRLVKAVCIAHRIVRWSSHRFFIHSSNTSTRDRRCRSSGLDPRRATAPRSHSHDFGRTRTGHDGRIENDDGSLEAKHCGAVSAQYCNCCRGYLTVRASRPTRQQRPADLVRAPFALPPQSHGWHMNDGRATVNRYCTSRSL